MYLGNQRRRSTLGRRFRNVDRPTDTVPAPTFPTMTPLHGVGRSRAGNQKASQDYMVRKQLFLKSPRFMLLSSGKKKNKAAGLSKVPSNSPNDSEGSFQSDSSLTLTGVQPMRDPSPNNRNFSASNSYSTKSFQEYRRPVPAIEISSPDSCIKSKISPTEKYNAMERPKSPGFSHYERLMRIERAKIKQPVDPDDLQLMKFLSIDEDLHSNPIQEREASTAAKEVTLPNEFSNFVHSKNTNKDLKFSSSYTETVNDSVKGTFKLHDLPSRENLTMGFENGVKITEDKDLFKISTEPKPNFTNTSSLTLGKQLKFETFGGRPSIFSRNNESSAEKCKAYVKNSNYEYFQNGDNQSIRKSHDVKTNSAKSPEKSKPLLEKIENFDSTLNSMLKNCNIGRLAQGVKLDTQDVDCTLNSSKVDLDSTLTNQEPQLPLSSAKKLSIIQESNERESPDIDLDLNSTDSFIKAENTVIEQEESMMESKSKTQYLEKSPSDTKVVGDENSLFISKEELSQALEKFDALEKNFNALQTHMDKLGDEMSSLKPFLNKLHIQIHGNKIKEENKENIPITESKQKSKSRIWFDELKSQNPDMLKTPKPEYRRNSRKSSANKSVMTPHSFSIAISDQLDDLFNC